MRLVGLEVLDGFVKKHADARAWVSSWAVELQSATWVSPQDVQDRYQNVGFLAEKKVVFNVSGDRYRLLCTVAYRTRIVLVNWIGTRDEYLQLEQGT